MGKTVKFSDSTGLFAEVIKTLVPRASTVLGFSDDNGTPKLGLFDWDVVNGEGLPEPEVLALISSNVKNWARTDYAGTDLKGDVDTLSNRVDDVKAIADRAALADGISRDGRNLNFTSDGGEAQYEDYTPGITIENDGTRVGNLNEIEKINFKGSGVNDITQVGTGVDVDISGGGDGNTPADLAAFKTLTETFQAARKNAVTEVFESTINVVTAGVNYGFSPAEESPTLEYPSALYKITIDSNETHTFPVTDLPTRAPNPVSYTHLTLPTICSV